MDLSWIAAAELGLAAYAAVAALSFLESISIVGLFVPGSSAVVVAAAAARAGWLRLDMVALAALLGALAGDLVSYWAGRRLADLPWLRARLATQRRAFDRAERLLAGFGALAVAVARCLPPTRSVTPLCAGALGVTRSAFAAGDAIGAAAWVGALVSMGQLAHWMLGGLPTPFLAGLSVLVTLGVLWLLLRNGGR